MHYCGGVDLRNPVFIIRNNAFSNITWALLIHPSPTSICLFIYHLLIHFSSIGAHIHPAITLVNSYYLKQYCPTQCELTALYYLFIYFVFLGWKYNWSNSWSNQWHSQLKISPKIQRLCRKFKRYACRKSTLVHLLNNTIVIATSTC